MSRMVFDSSKNIYDFATVYEVDDISGNFAYASDSDQYNMNYSVATSSEPEYLDPLRQTIYTEQTVWVKFAFVDSSSLTKGMYFAPLIQLTASTASTSSTFNFYFAPMGENISSVNTVVTSQLILEATRNTSTGFTSIAWRLYVSRQYSSVYMFTPVITFYII